MISDMHIHIRDGYQDLNILRLYANKAIERGIAKVVFLEHGNRLSNKHSSILSTRHNIDVYKNTLNKYHDSRLTVLSGIEIDYSDDLNFRKKTLELLDYGSFDWIIGSIHSIKFDNKCDYYYAIIDLINNYKINCIGHIKLDDDYMDYQDILDKIVKKAHDKNICIEINTSDRSRWSEEQLVYMLELMQKYNTKFIIGSDAHNYNEVGYLVEKTDKKIREIKAK